jgi:hypothetical protein
MAQVAIAEPYNVVPLDAASADEFETAIKAGLGAMSSVVQIGVRQVNKGSTNAGIVVAMAFPGVPGTNTAVFLDSVAAGSAGATGKVTKTTIGGQDVRLIDSPSAQGAVYRRGDMIMFAYSPTLAESIAIITAIIRAS